MRNEHRPFNLLIVMVSSSFMPRFKEVAVIATGDEVAAPGGKLHKRQLYASNMTDIYAWLSQLGLPCITELVDDKKRISITQ